MTQDNHRGESRETPKLPSAPAVELADRGKRERLVSLDAYRGAIMLLMASSGLGLAQVARQFPDSGLWQFLAHQTDHAPWAGMRLWDIIQPAFMFMVGVALPWSVANRRARGQSFGRIFGHALWRALILVLLAVFFTSAWSNRGLGFSNVLAQIGLGYPVVFAGLRPRTQRLPPSASCSSTGWRLLHPLPPADSTGKRGARELPHLTGFAVHREKNVNPRRLSTWFRTSPQRIPVFNADIRRSTSCPPSRRCSSACWRASSCAAVCRSPRS
jgi:hypothetical protein